MHTGTGRIVELVLENGGRYARLSCPEHLIPRPGQYLLARGPDALLPVPIFYTDSAPHGFIGLAPDLWEPGEVVYLRGPLGRGFSLPVSARKIGLVAFDHSPSCLRGLILPALRQDGSVVLLCDSSADGLPNEVEVQPLSTLGEILHWADFLALETQRENLKGLMDHLGTRPDHSVVYGVQILIHTPMPCGGLAECGVCALTTRAEWKMACRDGPVFDLKDIALP